MVLIKRASATGSNMRCFIVSLSRTVLGSRESPIRAWFSLFSCVTTEIDGVLHPLKDPLLKIYIHLVYKQSSVLFSWSLLISALPEIQYIPPSTLSLFLSVEQHTDFTASF